MSATISPCDSVLLRGDIVSEFFLVRAHIVIFNVVVENFDADIGITVLLCLVSPAPSREVISLLAPVPTQSLLDLVESQSCGDLGITLVYVPCAVCHHLRLPVFPDRTKGAVRLHDFANRCKVFFPVLAVEAHNSQLIGSPEECVDGGMALRLAIEHIGFDVAERLVHSRLPVVILPPAIVVDGFPRLVGVVELFVLVGSQRSLFHEEGGKVGVSIPVLESVLLLVWVVRILLVWILLRIRVLVLTIGVLILLLVPVLIAATAVLRTAAILRARA